MNCGKIVVGNCSDVMVKSLNAKVYFLKKIVD